MTISCQRSLQFVSVAFLSVAVVAFLASTALAQTTYLTGPGGSPPPTGPGTVGGEPAPGGVNSAIKTPPLQAGELVTIPIEVHNPGPAALPNWAGVLVSVHLADPSEVDIAAVRVGGVPQPHPFPTSGGPGSTVAIFTVFNPAAFFSGVSLQPSSVYPAISLDLVGKNTSPINNSDVDIELKFADIYHQPGVTLTTYIINTSPNSVHLPAVPGSTFVPRTVQGSTTWPVNDSHRWLVPSSIGGLPDLHLTAGGHQVNSDVPFPNAPPTVEFESKYALPRNVEPGTGHFIHLPAGIIHRVTSVVSFHLVGGRPGSTSVPAGGIISTLTAFIPGSQIYAVPFLATATIGIEHIPEPTAPLLLLGGMVSLACGFRSRRRRKLA